MSDLERRRIRKEAADSVTSGPPRAGESEAESAMRRYLGASLSALVRGGRRRGRDDTRGHDEAP
jgi:hypothetical protein